MPPVLGTNFAGELICVGSFLRIAATLQHCAHIGESAFSCEFKISSKLQHDKSVDLFAQSHCTVESVFLILGFESPHFKLLRLIKC